MGYVRKVSSGSGQPVAVGRGVKEAEVVLDVGGETIPITGFALVEIARAKVLEPLPEVVKPDLPVVASLRIEQILFDDGQISDFGRLGGDSERREDLLAQALELVVHNPGIPSRVDTYGMEDEIRPTDWFAGLDFGTDVYEATDGGSVRNTRAAGASPEADQLDRQTVPADDAAYRAQLATVFGTREAILCKRLRENVDARRLARTLDGTAAAERLFGVLSRALGELFGFEPAPVIWTPGLPADNAIGLFLRGRGWERVVLSLRLLERPAEFVDTVIHEQTHRLQHALTCRLNTPQIPLHPLERGLVLYWLRKEPERERDYARSARERDSRRRMALYRAIPIEHHAYSMAERVLKDAFPDLVSRRGS